MENWDKDELKEWYIALLNSLVLFSEKPGPFCFSVKNLLTEAGNFREGEIEQDGPMPLTTFQQLMQIDPELLVWWEEKKKNSNSPEVLSQAEESNKAEDEFFEKDNFLLCTTMGEKDKRLNTTESLAFISKFDSKIESLPNNEALFSRTLPPHPSLVPKEEHSDDEEGKINKRKNRNYINKFTLEKALELIKQIPSGRELRVSFINRKEANFFNDVLPIHPSILEALKKYIGKDFQFFSHQGESLISLLEREHIVLATSTSTGKSLVYMTYIAQRIYERHKFSDEESEVRDIISILLFPTKALAQDQLLEFENFYQYLPPKLTERLTPALFDGDTSQDMRKYAAANANILLTNPDIIHITLLQNWKQYAQLLCHIEFLVVDEAHAYRGTFGSHVSMVIRRLRRVRDFLRLLKQQNLMETLFTKKRSIQLHQFLILSDFPISPFLTMLSTATIRNPLELFRSLTGMNEEKVKLIMHDGAPSGMRAFCTWVKQGKGESLDDKIIAEKAKAETLVTVISQKEEEIVQPIDSRLEVKDNKDSSRKREEKEGKNEKINIEKSEKEMEHHGPQVKKERVIALGKNAKGKVFTYPPFKLSDSVMDDIKYEWATKKKRKGAILKAKNPRGERKSNEGQGDEESVPSHILDASTALDTDNDNIPYAIQYLIQLNNERSKFFIEKERAKEGGDKGEDEEDSTSLSGGISPILDASNLLAIFSIFGVRSIAFSKSRSSAEMIYKFANERIHAISRVFPSVETANVICYRAGYSKETRRKLESNIFNNFIDGISTTSALELGVNIGSLNASIIAGIPPTMSSLKQQSGRSGRGAKDSLTIVIPYESALERIYCEDPLKLYEMEAEQCLIDCSNENILRFHMRCSCHEFFSLSAQEIVYYFGPQALLTIPTLESKFLFASHHLHNDFILSKISSLTLQHNDSSSLSVTTHYPEEPAFLSLLALLTIHDKEEEIISIYKRHREKYFSPLGKAPHNELTLRNVDTKRVYLFADSAIKSFNETLSNTLQLIEKASRPQGQQQRGKIIDELPEEQATIFLYPGAVYLVRGREYVISKYDVSQCLAFGRPCVVDYYTRSREKVFVSVVSVRLHSEENATSLLHMLPQGACWEEIGLQSDASEFLLGEYGENSVHQGFIKAIKKLGSTSKGFLGAGKARMTQLSDFLSSLREGFPRYRVEDFGAGEEDWEEAFVYGEVCLPPLRVLEKRQHRLRDMMRDNEVGMYVHCIRECEGKNWPVKKALGLLEEKRIEGGAVKKRRVEEDGEDGWKETEVAITSVEDKEKEKLPDNGFVIADKKYGEIEITLYVDGYYKFKKNTNKLFETLDLEKTTYIKKKEAFWVELAPSLSFLFARRSLDFKAALHACNHALLMTLPSIVAVDMKDISCLCEEQKGVSNVLLIYDVVNGSGNTSLFMYNNINKLLPLAMKMLDECECSSGCPNCCYIGCCPLYNEGLDRKGGALVLKWVMKSLIEGKESMGQDQEFLQMWELPPCATAPEPLGPPVRSGEEAQGMFLGSSTRQGGWTVKAERFI